MSSKAPSRRSFLIRSVTGLNAAWLATNYPAILAAQEHVQQATQAGQTPKLGFFTAEQAAEIDAFAAQIIPTDETPGAREAHCLYFIDRALTTFAKKNQSAYAKGIEDLQAKAKELYPGATKFSALAADQQIAVMKAIEKTPFFTLARNHTVIGFFARPEHGGNAGKIGWKLIGYDDSLNFKPPFGYYDAEAMGKA